MQTASSRNWTLNVESISFHNNCYVTQGFQLVDKNEYEPNEIEKKRF